MGLSIVFVLIFITPFVFIFLQVLDKFCKYFRTYLFLTLGDFSHLKTFACQEHAKGGKCIVFTQTKRDADRLAYTMARSYKCEALHGDISQNQRERTLAGFRSGHFNILVATDVASRGLDIPNVDLVRIIRPFLFVHVETSNFSLLVLTSLSLSLSR